MNPPEERVLQALRQANVIPKSIFDQCVALLEATVTCDKCGGDGNSAPPELADIAPACNKCESTGQMFVIR